MRLVAVLLALAACERAHEARVERDAGVTRDAAPTPVVPSCRQEASAKIENTGRCDRDADCVLTTAPAACNACDLAQDYPTLKASVDERNARCGPASCATDCPKHDWYIHAFYRAECRRHHCIAWRYHGGG